MLLQLQNGMLLILWLLPASSDFWLNSGTGITEIILPVNRGVRIVRLMEGGRCSKSEQLQVCFMS